MRIGVLALSGALLFPAVAAAQADPGFTVDPNPNVLPFAPFAVTPYVGFRLPYGTGDYFVQLQDGTQFRIRDERGGGAAIGLQVEGQVHGPLSVVAAGTYSAGTPDDVFIQTGAESISIIRLDGPEVWFAKLGLSYRLPDPSPDTRRYHPAAAVSVAPAMVWTRPRGFEGFGEELTRDRQHLALNLAADVSQRLGSRGLALHFGVENYFTFWNSGGTRLRDEALFREVFSEPVTVLYDRTHANLLMLRGGLSFRF
jgi:hypothetical protein